MFTPEKRQKQKTYLNVFVIKTYEMKLEVKFSAPKIKFRSFNSFYRTKSDNCAFRTYFSFPPIYINIDSG